MFGVRDEIRAPVVEHLDPPDLHIPILHVDPVILHARLRRSSLLHHMQLPEQESDGQEVAIPQAACHLADVRRRRGRRHRDQLAEGHRREEIVASDLLDRKSVV